MGFGRGGGGESNFDVQYFSAFRPQSVPKIVLRSYIIDDRDRTYDNGRGKDITLWSPDPNAPVDFFDYPVLQQMPNGFAWVETVTISLPPYATIRNIGFSCDIVGYPGPTLWDSRSSGYLTTEMLSPGAFGLPSNWPFLQPLRQQMNWANFPPVVLNLGKRSTSEQEIILTVNNQGKTAADMKILALAQQADGHLLYRPGPSLSPAVRTIVTFPPSKLTDFKWTIDLKDKPRYLYLVMKVNDAVAFSAWDLATGTSPVAP